MLNRKLYILLAVLGVLFFALQPAKAANSEQTRYKLHCNVFKKPFKAAHSHYTDLLLNTDDDNDDETSSRIKYKLNRFSIFFKFNLCRQNLPFYGALQAFAAFDEQPVHGIFLFSKTPINITVRCLRL